MPNDADDAPTLPAQTISQTEAATAGEAATIPSSYVVGGLIGHGGMGDVIAARDERIGRDVAIKRMRKTTSGDETIARFLREARIQARLDHPAIVPVYELGHDAAGLPYFAMKRLAGVTLHERLAERGPVQPLLRAFADICLAIEFAHTRNVVHRDLKPSNVMLGSFGEVYVLDWGLARVLTDNEKRPSRDDLTGPEGGTLAGALLGTPGYMPPEQITDAAQVDGSADVYALGAILFEILAGQRLHAPEADALASTIDGIDGSPARRASERDVPPELDALCVQTLATEPSQRPTAGELAKAVQRYLDGDRDLERRRAMAIEQLGGARVALAAGDRSEAMRAAARAVALDPTATEAAELVTALMIEPPRDPPPALRAELVAHERAEASRHARIAAAAYLGCVVLFPVAMWNGIESWPLVVTTVALSVIQSMLAWSISSTPSRGRYVIYVVGNAVMISLFDRVLGPFVVAPAFACLLMMSLLLYPAYARRARAIVPLLLGGWLAPIGLEAAGALARTWMVSDGTLSSMSTAIRVSGASTAVFLLIVMFALLALAGVLAATVARSRNAAQQQLVTQAWHLRQLLPHRR